MKKYDLSDVTVIIPYMIDSKDRLQNLNCILKYLNENFETNIFLVESGDKIWFNKLIPCGARHFFTPAVNGIFHRTQQINLGIKNCNTPYIAIWDADCVLPTLNIFRASELLRKGITLVYPYSGAFKDIDRSYIKTGVVKESESYAMDSVGGVCFLNRKDYIACGMENEKLISHCPDDISRYIIIKTLGYKIERVEGTCWHIKHSLGLNSIGNQFTEANNAEFNKVRKMSKEQLKSYISTWNY
jgi:hypothetical protein